MRLLKYIESGLFVAVLQLAVFSALLHVLDLSYLTASTYAFVVAVVTSFLLQKYWTFQNKEKKMQGQFFFFLTNSLWGLLLNTFFMWGLVEKLLAPKLLAQVLTMAFLASYNYFIYRLIFKVSKDKSLPLGGLPL